MFNVNTFTFLKLLLFFICMLFLYLLRIVVYSPTYATMFFLLCFVPYINYSVHIRKGENVVTSKDTTSRVLSIHK